jgi:hypothetical protein
MMTGRTMKLAVAALCCIFPAAVWAQSAPSTPPGSDENKWLPPATTAVLQTLDKITGRVRTIEAPVGEAVRFITLSITAHVCRKRPPEEPPESAAFLEIREIKPGEQPRAVFTGWMFASSPAVSALESPVYDVWVLDCKSAAAAPAPAPRSR